MSASIRQAVRSKRLTLNTTLLLLAIPLLMATSGGSIARDKPQPGPDTDQYLAPTEVAAPKYLQETSSDSAPSLSKRDAAPGFRPRSGDDEEAAIDSAKQAAEENPVQSPQIRTLGPPPGFMDNDGPQSTLVDVYYGGRFLLSSMAEFTPQFLRFQQAAHLIQRVPDVANPDELTRILGQALDTNADLVCRHAEQPACGRLEPEQAGIIFDENRFRVDLFIHRDLLTRPDPAQRRYLPAPDHERLTAVQNLRSLYTDGSNSDGSYSLFGQTHIGKGNQFAFANWVSTDNQAISVDEAGYRRDLQDHQMTLGLFETSTSSLRALSRQPLLGIAIGTSLQRRNDLDAVIASPIEVFLPSRSRVDVFRDGRLISSGFYEAGNQLIDTRSLAAGSYPVDIVITDSRGDVRTEQLLFVKSSLLAPAGEPQWLIELGDVRRRAGQEDTFPGNMDTRLLRAAYHWRHNQRLGLGVAGASSGGSHLGELSADILFAGLQAGGEVFASSSGGRGYGLRLASHWGDYSLSANLQHIDADDVRNDERDFRLLDLDQRLYSARLSRHLWQGQIAFNASQSQQVDGRQVRRTNLQYNRSHQLGFRRSLIWRIEIGEQQGDWRGQFTVQWRSGRGNWNDSAEFAFSDSKADDGRDGYSAAVGTRWHNNHSAIGDAMLGMRVQAGPGNRYNASLDAEHRSHLGYLKTGINVADQQRDGGRQYAALLGYNTSFVLGEQGQMIMGGPSPAGAGVIVDLRDAPKGKFDLRIDGGHQLSTTGGKRVAITLPPYREYRLSLVERGGSMISFDPTPQHVALYPGQVVTRAWSLVTINVLVARVYWRQSHCDEHGHCKSEWQPLSNAVLSGVEGFAATDDEGFVQAEVASDVSTLHINHLGQSCQIDLAGLEPIESVLRAPRLLCSSVDSPE